MNEQLEEFARSNIKEGLSMLPTENQRTFKLMYSPDDPDAEINGVVDAMPADRLDWAMQQVQRSVDQMKKG